MSNGVRHCRMDPDEGAVRRRLRGDAEAAVLRPRSNSPRPTMSNAWRRCQESDVIVARRPSRACAAPPCATCDIPRSRTAVVHAGEPLGRLVPVLAQRLDVGPVADAEAGRVGRAERQASRRRSGRTTGTSSTSARNCISRLLAVMPPSTLSVRELDAGVAVHGLDDLARLPRRRLQHGAREVALGDVAGQAGDHAAGVAAPVRREQARRTRARSSSRRCPRPCAPASRSRAR